MESATKYFEQSKVYASVKREVCYAYRILSFDRWRNFDERGAGCAGLWHIWHWRLNLPDGRWLFPFRWWLSCFNRAFGLLFSCGAGAGLFVLVPAEGEQMESLRAVG